MKTNKPILKAAGHYSGMQTPIDALYPLLPYLRHVLITRTHGQVVFDGAAGEGMLLNGLRKLGIKATGKNLSAEYDFLVTAVPEEADVLVMNPPYDQKDKFLARAYEIGLPFAFLLPIESLGGSRRQILYRKQGIQLILFPYRINFVTPNGGTSAWFPTAWFCYKFNLPHDLMFVEDTRPQGDIK